MYNLCKTIINYFMPGYYKLNKTNEILAEENNTNCYNTLSNIKNRKNNKIEQKKINLNLFDNNYFYKLLYINNSECKCYSLSDAVKRNNYTIHKSEILQNCIKLYKNIYLKEKFIYKFSTDIDKRRYLYVIRYLYNNKAPNIILPTDIYEEIQSSISNKKTLLQKIPYKKHGDLFTYFTHNKLKYYEKYTIFYKIVKIIKDLHSINISHRDIKLENIIIDFSPNLELYLIDFEFSNNNKNNNKFNGGTPCYAAPELLNNNINIDNFNCVDIWALGIILNIFIFNNLPWAHADINCNYYNDYLNDPLYFTTMISDLNIPSTHKLIYKKILNYCFNLNYNKRTDINYIFNLL